MMARLKGPRRSPDVIQRAVNRYMADEPVDTIAKDIGVTQPTISYWMKKFGKTYGGKTFKLRSRGRRTSDEPSPRDKQIILLYAMGVPAAVLANEYDLKRQRVGYIIKLWQDRGYTPPPPPFEAGDLVKFDGDEYLLLDVYDHKRGRAKLVTEVINGKRCPVQEEIISEPFLFYADGKMAKVIKKNAMAEVGQPVAA